VRERLGADTSRGTPHQPDRSHAHEYLKPSMDASDRHRLEPSETAQASRSGLEAARDHALDAHALQGLSVRASDHDHAARAVRPGMLLGRQDECRPHQGEDGEKCHDPSIRFHGQRSTAHPVTVELRGA
jgi:hypothetical protein